MQFAVRKNVASCQAETFSHICYNKFTCLTKLLVQPLFLKPSQTHKNRLCRTNRLVTVSKTRQRVTCLLSDLFAGWRHNEQGNLNPSIKQGRDSVFLRWLILLCLHVTRHTLVIQNMTHQTTRVTVLLSAAGIYLQ
jgi:hypothetical protein